MCRLCGIPQHYENSKYSNYYDWYTDEIEDWIREYPIQLKEDLEEKERTKKTNKMLDDWRKEQSNKGKEFMRNKK
jgi:hypothetical protein